MDATAVIKTALTMSDEWLTALLNDVKDAPTTFPTPNGGNHPLWAIGHIAHSEASLVAGFVLGEENPLKKWDELFGMGSQPVADASVYPPFDEVLAAYRRARANTLSVLERMSTEELSKPSHAPEEYKSMFGTVGQCLMSVSLHAVFHAGQIADARRAMGKQPVFG
jgi:hypothetical protein